MTLEPTIAVTTLERALRLLLSRELRGAWREGWLERATTAQQRKRWQERYEQEQARRPGAASVPAVGLEYSELYELIALLDEHWDAAGAALGKKKQVLPLLEHFERIRNTASHSRELLPFERQLMSGIAGEIQNKVTIRMSSQDPTGDYYPRIVSAVDNFGTAIVIADELDEMAGQVPAGARRMVLQVGDVVTFTCVGTDPKGRELEWTLNRPRGAYLVVLGPSGEPTELTWQVSDEDVEESAAVQIYMSTADSPYHRWKHFDHRVWFPYVVRPPDFT